MEPTTNLDTMNEKEINEAYDTLLEKADKIATDLTKDDAKQISEAINEATSTDDNKFIDSLPSNNGTLENENNNAAPIEKKAEVTINPTTGTADMARELGISEETVRLLDLKPEDIFDMPESINDVEIDPEFIRKAILESKSVDSNDAELVEQLVDLTTEYKKTEDKDSVNWYTKMPDKIKAEINKVCATMNNNDRKVRKDMADFFLSEIISDSGFDKIIYDFQDSMNKAFDTDGIMAYFVEEAMTEFEKGMDNTIEKLRNIESDKDKELIDAKIQQLNDIKEAYRQSYTYEGFIAAIKNGKVRVKKKDIDRYARYVRGWLSKYEGDTPFIIQDPTRIAPIILRIFENRYTPEQCVAFVIGFMQYTQNYDAKNVVDHTFMSYFVSNIIQLDLFKKTPEQANFINILSNSIIKAMNAINNIEEREEENNEE